MTEIEKLQDKVARPRKMNAAEGGLELLRTGPEFARPPASNRFAVAAQLAGGASPPSLDRKSTEKSPASEPPSGAAPKQSSRQQRWRDTVAPDSVSSTASDTDNEPQQLDLSHNDSEPRNQKPHVGPMGIFFKVWSLVKVTKSRHNNRVKRPMGELNAGHQFHYMAGDRSGASPSEGSTVIPGGCLAQQQRGVQRPTLLQESHFKRAGSQPPPSSQLSPSASGATKTSANCGTASSSSGLSSTTSSTLATNYAVPNWAVRIRRTTPPGVNQNSNGAPSRGGSAANKVQSNDDSHHDSRQPRALSDSSQLDDLRKRALSAAGPGKPMSRLAAGGQKSRISFRRLRHRLRQHSVSDDTGDEEFDDEDDEKEAEEVKFSGEKYDESQPRTTRPNQEKDDDELDSDMNEIYSTPNDSIQSVPNGQPTQTSDLESKQMSGRQMFKITKSFSTNFSSSNSSGAETPMGAESSRTRRGASDEPNRVGESCRSPMSETPPRRSAEAKRAHAITGSTGNSRFFISSSSSEDSNPSQQSSIQCSIPVRSALHHHAPARPSSLFLMEQTNHSSNLPSLLTPSTLLISGTDCGRPDRESSAHIHQGAKQVASPSCWLIGQTNEQLHNGTQYKKSPSLFDMKPQRTNPDMTQRFSSKYPRSSPMSSFVPQQPITRPLAHLNEARQIPSRFSMSNSISLHDCKLASVEPREQLLECPVESVEEERATELNQGELNQGEARKSEAKHLLASEYRLAQMLLELGSNPAAKDEFGWTALMHAVRSENLAAFKCLVEHGVNLDEVNHSGQSALDLICEKPASEIRLEMLKFMIDNQVDLDRNRKKDKSRLLDRLIEQHRRPANDKSPYIDSLLHNGAKLGSATWSAASGKHEIQLKLLKKLCQDGYYLYKKLSIEAAVFRFEYALKRLDELEQQLVANCHRSKCYISKCCHLLDKRQQLDPNERQLVARECQQVKYQIFLGLSRCERKRGFFKRALEFANMSILIDSTSYEGYYSKAHILKDIGEKAEALSTIGQAERLVGKSLEITRNQLNELDVQEESLVFDTCFNIHEPNKLNWIESTRKDMANTLDYLTDAKKHIMRMRNEIETSNSLELS